MASAAACAAGSRVVRKSRAASSSRCNHRKLDFQPLDIAFGENLLVAAPGSSGVPADKECRRRRSARPGDRTREQAHLVLAWTIEPSWPPTASRHSLFHWGVKGTVDLHYVIVEQTLDLDHRAGGYGGFPQSSACALSTMGAKRCRSLT